MLGFAFKADTGDTRESAAITLIRDFCQERAKINIYDPQVEHSQIWMDLSEALLATENDSMYHSPNLNVFDMSNVPCSQKTGDHLRICD